jgi:hypothetical protein
MGSLENQLQISNACKSYTSTSNISTLSFNINVTMIIHVFIVSTNYVKPLLPKAV